MKHCIDELGLFYEDVWQLKYLHLGLVDKKTVGSLSSLYTTSLIYNKHNIIESLLVIMIIFGFALWAKMEKMEKSVGKTIKKFRLLWHFLYRLNTIKFTLLNFVKLNDTI